ncbi:hypothetical protein BXZ70DRAFT_912270 [Cristinia sonorae]|uniref:Uncharacterized protein n=1 Tax=Cristinia sonorae TaxID=1940300 RepID=A0A8K0V153_9AGAR|nr:hypothetical protein BXZ70DRAFT_912270 [Cristinia sonorae]
MTYVCMSVALLPQLMTDIFDLIVELAGTPSDRHRWHVLAGRDEVFYRRLLLRNSTLSSGVASLIAYRVDVLSITARLEMLFVLSGGSLPSIRHQEPANDSFSSRRPVERPYAVMERI